MDSIDCLRGSGIPKSGHGEAKPGYHRFLRGLPPTEDIDILMGSGSRNLAVETLSMEIISFLLNRKKEHVDVKRAMRSWNLTVWAPSLEICPWNTHTINNGTL